MTSFPHSLTLRALAGLLAYPSPDLRSEWSSISKVLESQKQLSSKRKIEIGILLKHLQHDDPLELESRYVECFDRGRSTCLYLFEHIHGDSRDRGPAMVDLVQMYAGAGLYLSPNELPDYLPVILEFASTQPPSQARAFLKEMTHIIKIIFSALLARNSPYASVLGAIIEFAGDKAEAVVLQPDPPIDEEWGSPPAFDGCSTQGQGKTIHTTTPSNNTPTTQHPLHFVRPTSHRSTTPHTP